MHRILQKQSSWPRGKEPIAKYYVFIRVFYNYTHITFSNWLSSPVLDGNILNCINILSDGDVTVNMATELSATDLYLQCNNAAKNKYQVSCGLSSSSGRKTCIHTLR